MTAGSLNTQLAQCYLTYTQSIYAKEWEDNVSAPLLMHVYDEYVTMARKILFVGNRSLPRLTFQTKHPRTLLGSGAKSVSRGIGILLAMHF
ncbi:MAG TPA: hypothetical protein VN038_14810 [Dyadobacter sp.]|nr:hypothetical protein [Dyadobacter sp.]